MSLLKVILKRVTLGLAFLLLLWVIFVILMPKKSLWYEAESLLQKQKIILHGETVNDKLFTLELLHSELYAGRIKVARIQSIELSIWGLFNTIDIRNLFVGTELPSLTGLHLKSAQITQSFFGDMVINALGNFGKVVGKVDQGQRLLELYIEPTAWLKKQPMIMDKLHKKAKGYYFAWHY